MQHRATFENEFCCFVGQFFATSDDFLELVLLLRWTAPLRQSFATSDDFWELISLTVFLRHRTTLDVHIFARGRIIRRQKHCTQHGFVAIGADGSNWTLGILLYFCCGRTETNGTFVSNWTSVIYIGKRSGRSVSNSPTSTSPFRWRQVFSGTFAGTLGTGELVRNWYSIP